MEKIGIKTNDAFGIGDKLQFSSIPENFFYTYGYKIIDIDKCWIYDYNPYVDRTSCPEKIYNPWLSQNSNLEHKIRNNTLKYPLLGLSLRAAAALDLNLKLRHNRLYIYEDEETDYKKVVVHTNGKIEGGEINDLIIDQIRNNYKNYSIYQIGGKDDKKTPFIDMRGLNIWETAKFISSAAIFIGVNSSMMHLANCYPKVRKKIILLQYNQNDLKYFYPSAYGNYTHWIDYNNELYNQYDIDIGATMSFIKI
jgi:hypothetical protein